MPCPFDQLTKRLSDYILESHKSLVEVSPAKGISVAGLPGLNRVKNESILVCCRLLLFKKRKIGVNLT